jgi:hypothetical protein
LRLKELTAVGLAYFILAGCGNGSAGMDAMGGPGPPARGTLLDTAPQLLSTLTASSLLAELNAASNLSLLAISGTPVCDVLMYHIRYETVGGAGEPTTASAALMVPTGVGGSCTGARPTVLYAHGTTTDKNFNMTNSQNAETLFLTAIFASQGYIVVAPNYAGYDTSTLPYHPYLIAGQQSKDMIDALAAARTALPLASATLTKDDGRLFVTGYSQGGYVAMATQRAMQDAGMVVTAAAPMSGPYALSAFVDAVFYGEVNGDGPISATFLLTAYQHAYGNMYTDPAEVFSPQYASGIDSLLPTTSLRSQLYATGKLPQYALFSTAFPAPQFADITPPPTPADLAPVFALGFGSDNLLLNSFRLQYLQDAQAHPDGGFPALTNGMAASQSELPWRRALQNNDLRDWIPTAPVQLCGGALDPIVFYFNTQLMQHYWSTNAIPSVTVAAVDLEASTPNDPYASLKRDFAAAKTVVAADAVAQGATDGGAFAVAEAYHAELVAPFCMAATRTFFAARL